MKTIDYYAAKDPVTSGMSAEAAVIARSTLTMQNMADAISYSEETAREAGATMKNLIEATNRITALIEELLAAQEMQERYAARLTAGSSGSVAVYEQKSWLTTLGGQLKSLMDRLAG